jgi:hypothetical protein
MAGGVDAVLDARGARTGRRRLDPVVMRAAGPRIVAILCVAAVAALVSDGADWQPLSLVVALAATMIVADVLAVRARRVRVNGPLDAEDRWPA